MNNRKFSRTPKGQQDGMLLAMERAKTEALQIQLKRTMAAFLMAYKCIGEIYPDLKMLDAANNNMKKNKDPIQTFDDFLEEIQKRTEAMHE